MWSSQISFTHRENAVPTELHLDISGGLTSLKQLFNSVAKRLTNFSCRILKYIYISLHMFRKIQYALFNDVKLVIKEQRSFLPQVVFVYFMRVKHMTTCGPPSFWYFQCFIQFFFDVKNKLCTNAIARIITAVLSSLKYSFYLKYIPLSILKWYYSIYL